MRGLIRLIIGIVSFAVIIIGSINMAQLYNEPLSYIEKNTPEEDSKVTQTKEMVDVARAIASSALEASEEYEENTGKEPDKFSDFLTFEEKDDPDKTPIVTKERKKYIKNIEGIDTNELVVTFNNGIQAYYSLDDAGGFTFDYEPPYGL